MIEILSQLMLSYFFKHRWMIYLDIDLWIILFALILEKFLFIQIK